MNPIPDVKYFYEGDPNRPWGKEIMVSDDAAIEFQKLLCLKYPDRVINRADIMLVELFKNFLAQPKYYIITFLYRDRFYELYTKKGDVFHCNQINIKKPYDLNILDIAITKIAIALKKPILAEEVAINLFEEKQLTDEMNYRFCITFKDRKFFLCFNHMGEVRNWS